MFLYAVKNYAKQLIWINLIVGLIFSVAALVLAARAGSVVGVILMAILLGLNILYVYYVRHRIPFAVAILRVSVKAIQQFNGAIGIAIFGIVIQTAYLYFFYLAAGSIAYASNQNQNGTNKNNTTSDASPIVYIALALSFYWTVEVIKNTVHTAIAGVAATYYFQYPHAVPKNPSWNSLKRACTYSFGSICFGSLIVAIIRTLRLILRNAEQEARRSNSPAAAIVLCLVQCIVGCIESIIMYINKYAFAEIAIYGKK